MQEGKVNIGFHVLWYTIHVGCLKIKTIIHVRHFLSYLFCTNTTDSHKQFFLVEKTYREAIDWGME